MKSLLLLCALLSAGARLFAQGDVNFSNATSAYGVAVPDHLVRWDNTAQLYNPVLTPGGLVSSNFGGANLSTLRAQLFYGASTASTSDSLTPVAYAPATFRASTSSNAGAWIGGYRTLLGFNLFETVHLNVIVWDTSIVADPAQALATSGGGGLFGMSGIFNYTIPNFGPEFHWLPANQPAFLVGLPVPEPSGIALLVLGATLLVRKPLRDSPPGPIKRSRTVSNLKLGHLDIIKYGNMGTK
jgi:hypothetical protein